MIVEQTLELSDRPLSVRAREFIDAGRSRFKSVQVFGFVPSDYELAWRVLDGLPRSTLCEWGSGFGIITGLAEMLGFEACGIEMSADLAVASRCLLKDFGLSASIETGDYLNIDQVADYYYVYCWPGQTIATETRFESIAPKQAKLLICAGQSDIRCKTRGLIDLE